MTQQEALDRVGEYLVELNQLSSVWAAERGGIAFYWMLLICSVGMLAEAFNGLMADYNRPQSKSCKGELMRTMLSEFYKFSDFYLNDNGSDNEDDAQGDGILQNNEDD